MLHDELFSHRINVAATNRQHAGCERLLCAYYLLQSMKMGLQDGLHCTTGLKRFWISRARDEVTTLTI